MSTEIKFGWIDYSKYDRDKVMSVLHILSEPQAVDELGVGLIRDGFANILFPGTSTVQTRAKYFLIVPYLLMELEKEKNLTPKKMMEKLSEKEISIIPILNKENSEGVIGKLSGPRLKRKPSSIYWNGIRTFGIFKYDKISLGEYIKAVCALKNQNDKIKKLGNEGIEGEISRDDIDALNGEIVSEFWSCIQPQKDWVENLDIELTLEEAEYLKSKIIKSKKSKNTLLSYLLKEARGKIEEINDFDIIGEVFDLPIGIKEDYYMARDFSDFIYGANIRYNYILSKGNNEDIKGEWTKWYESDFVKYKFKHFDIYAVIKRLDIRSGSVVRFLNQWKEKLLNGNLEEIDKLIISREEEIKGKQRAKLTNPKLAFYGDNNMIRGSKLEYRFTPGRRLIVDIFRGIEGEQND